MKKNLNIQIQQIRSKVAIEKIETLLHLLHSLKKIPCGIWVDFCPSENYCNVGIESKEGSRLWRAFSKCVDSHPKEFRWLKSRWIVVFEGETGWTDYLMLAHFDSSVLLDLIA